MIDTIILRIHDTQKYQNMIRWLDMLDKKGYTTETGKVQGKEIRKLRNQGIKNGGEVLSILKMNRTGEFLIKSKVAKQVSASNHYSFSYFVNYTSNFTEFNFSIPKYVYGSNVMMFVEHIGDKNYNLPDCSQLEYNIDRAFDRLEVFLRQFFRMEFVNVKFDPLDIEVHRIDVCFNQVFRSKAEALKYLEYQKRQRKKYSRNEEGVMRDWETSLMYTTQRYSAKIYHKGSEYKKNDLKEHQKLNREKGKQYFRTEEYQEFADKILRYELTIRNGMLNYLHKKSLFRRNCPHWQRYHKIYEKVDASKQKNDRIAKKIGELDAKEKEEYRKLHPYDKIDKESRDIHKSVSKVINQRTRFVLAEDEESHYYNKQMVNYSCNKAFFSKGLLKLCMEKLVDFIHEYQIKELPPEDMIAKLIDDYNFRHKKRLPKTDMVNFYKDLLRVGSFKETAKMTYISRATLYRYKQRFKQIGITDSNLIPLTEDGLPRAEVDLREYHSAHMFNMRFLAKNSFFDYF